MRSRSIASPAAVISIVLVALAFGPSLASPVSAQQGASGAAAVSPTLPVDVKAKLEKLQAGLEAAQAAADAKAEATELNAIGTLYFGVAEYKKALDSYNQALIQARGARDAQLEAAALNGMGDCYRNQSQNSKAQLTYKQSLDIATASGDLRGRATALNGLGWTSSGTGQNEKALELFNQALPLFRQVGDRDGEAASLDGIGWAYGGLGEPQDALRFYGQALTIYREVDDRNGEGRVLNNIGLVYSGLGEPLKALDLFSQALPIRRAVGDRAGVAATLNNMGLVSSSLGQPQKAIDDYNQALLIYLAVGEGDGEADTLDLIGLASSGLGQPQRALESFNRALTIYQFVGDRAGEADALIDIGMASNSMGDKQKALDSYNQALLILRQVGDPTGEGAALTNIGSVYLSLQEPQKALDFYNQALPFYRQAGYRYGEISTLIGIGAVYSALSQPQKTVDYLYQALPAATAVQDPILEAYVFYDLMATERRQYPSLAVFYGKQAVNLLQQMRGNIQALDKESQKSFLASKDNYYRALATLLIAQGRLPEAQQVLDLLKQQEYQDYVRGDTPAALSPLSLTPAEQQAEADYQKSTAQLVSLGEQWTQLKKISARTAEQNRRFQQVSDELDSASKGLNDYYARLYTLFGQNSGANKQVAEVKGDVSLLRHIIAKMPHTVALYTLVGSDRVSIIVITGATVAAREYPIAEQDLNRKIADLQQALRDPRSDPRALATELYNILVGPVKADLDQAHAQTLVWSLDGALRYVPIAALYDGEHYVVENYATVTITPASIPHLADTPDVGNLSAVAMGISKQYEENLPALPAVVGELDGIVKDAQVQGANGVLPGTILLNGAFTEKAMEAQLGGSHSVIHIASHFVFQPGDDSQSYLLLAGKNVGGSGFRLTVADFRDNQNLSLDDTDLLTLSACETGISGNASNGREVDGLGTTAQLKGAKAVISSLWEVNDASTGALMADFYKRWAEGDGKTAKVEALRQAQLDLLEGRIVPHSGASGRGLTAESEPGKQASPAGYAHPYYWAPFVLMGNWR